MGFLAFLSVRKAHEAYLKGDVQAYITADMAALNWVVQSSKRRDDLLLQKLKGLAKEKVTLAVIRGASHPMVPSAELGFDLFVSLGPARAMQGPDNQLGFIKMLGETVSVEEEELRLLQGAAFNLMLNGMGGVKIDEIGRRTLASENARLWTADECRQLFLKDGKTEERVRDWIKTRGTRQLKEALGIKTDGGGATQAPGGIDFSRLPVRRHIDPALLADVPARALDTRQEWEAIARMAGSGMTPSSRRIKEFVVCCYRQDALKEYAEKTLRCVEDILRQEEEKCRPTDPDLRAALLLLESS
jgi:hypothetical protein